MYTYISLSFLSRSFSVNAFLEVLVFTALDTLCAAFKALIRCIKYNLRVMLRISMKQNRGKQWHCYNTVKVCFSFSSYDHPLSWLSIWWLVFSYLIWSNIQMTFLNVSASRIEIWFRYIRNTKNSSLHADVMIWECFPHYSFFVRRTEFPTLRARDAELGFVVAFASYWINSRVVGDLSRRNVHVPSL